MPSKNPWKSKADVARHNRACSENSKCRKQWLRVANDIYNTYGESGAARAIISANSYVKRHRLKNPIENNFIESVSSLWLKNYDLDEIIEELDVDVDPLDLLNEIQQWRRIYGEDNFPYRLK